MNFSLKSILFVKWHNGSIVALKYFEIFWISFICFVLPNLIQLWNLWWWIQWKTIISHPKNSASFFLLALCEYACYLSICVHIWVTWDKFSRQGNCLFGLGGAAQTPVNTSANTSQQCALNTRTPTHVLLLRALKEGKRNTRQLIQTWIGVLTHPAITDQHHGDIHSVKPGLWYLDGYDEDEDTEETSEPDWSMMIIALPLTITVKKQQQKLKTITITLRRMRMI